MKILNAKNKVKKKIVNPKICINRFLERMFAALIIDLLGSTNSGMKHCFSGNSLNVEKT
jgi:hypothetical protein